MMDMQAFGEWMEQGLTEGVIEGKAEKCLLAFVLPSGEVLLGDWKLEREDVEKISNELVISIRDMLVLEAMQELEAEMEDGEGEWETE